MSLVARQGIKYSIIGYLGYLLGIFSSLFIFPRALGFYGTASYVFSMAELFLPLVVFGLSYSNVKFFQEAQKESRHQNILSLSLVSIVVNFCIFLAGFFLAAFIFPNIKELKLWEYRGVILALTLVISISAVLNKYISNYKRIVIPNIFESFFPKLANFGAVVLFFFFGWKENSALLFFFGMFFLALLGYVYYCNRLEKFKPDFRLDYVKKDGLWQKILNYSFYGFLGNLGIFVTLKINNFIIGEYFGMEENGLYNNVISIITLITIPALGLYNIAAPIINKHFADNTIAELDKFHKQTSLSLFFIGSVLFSCILVGFPFLTDFMERGELFRQAQPILWMVGLAKLFDLATGFNSNIISLSKYYRFNIYIMLFLAVLTVLLDLYFVFETSLGIYGIAIGSSIALFVYNGIKIVYNYYRFRVFPLSLKMLYTFVLCAVSVSIVIFIPNFQSSLANLFVKPTLVLVLIFLGNHFMKIYPLEKYLNKKFVGSLFKF